MAKLVSEKQVINYVKGIVTEANPLTFPENASLDEANMSLELNGSRQRRLGVDYETGFSLTNTGLADTTLASTKQSFLTWNFPGGATDIVLGVVRVEDRLYFFDTLKANPSSFPKNSGNYITISGLGNADIQTTQIGTYFVIVSEALSYPILLSYNKTTDIIEQEEIAIEIRDLFGVAEDLSPDERPLILSNKHKYNLINQGWSDRISSSCSTGAYTTTIRKRYYSSNGDALIDIEKIEHPAVTVSAIQCTFNKKGFYPSNTDVWTLGKVGNTASGDFEKYDPETLIKNSISTGDAPKGALILNCFDRGTDRILLSGISDLPLDKEKSSFTTIASYGSRVFYSGVNSDIENKDGASPDYSSYIFFSQIVISKEKLGRCYQENDPTSEDISDLLDSDGGTIVIPEISKVIKLIPSDRALLVLAENGIWEISGGTSDGFTATGYQVNKISSLGITNPNSVVDVRGTIFYWTKSGIYLITPNPNTGRLTSQSISLTTIQTLFNDIPNTAKLHCKGFYDEKLEAVRWLYNDSADYSTSNYINKYTKELIFNLPLQAFTVNTISSLVNSSSPYICDYIKLSNYASSVVEDQVYVESQPIILTLGDNVIINIESTVSRGSDFGFLIFKESNFTFGKYSNTSFYDWVTADTVGVNYSSYLLTGYELFGDNLREKQSSVLLFYFERTENGFTDNGGILTADNPSSCLVQAQWNWTNSIASGRWGPQFQAYRYVRNYIPSGADDTFDSGDRVIVTRNKIRGSGRALSFKIESDPGKDLRLLGWAQEITGNSKT